MLGDLERTFELLARTRQPVALDLLIAAMDSAAPSVRKLAVRSLLQRGEERGLQAIIDHWHGLDPGEIETLCEHERRLTPSIIRTLSRSTGEGVGQAIAAARRLHSLRTIPALLEIAQAADSPHQSVAIQTILHLANSLGRAARQDRDTPSLRAPVLERLADAVRRFPRHRHADLVDAFLCAVRWEDGCLTSLLADDEPTSQIIAQRLEHSPQPGVIQLLAGWIRRHRIPNLVQRVLRNRSDQTFRDELLTCVGQDPSSHVLKQLRSLGTPACCRPIDRLFVQLPRTAWPAAVHLIAASEADSLRTLRMLLDALDLHDSPTTESAIRELQKLNGIDPQVWLRAAAEIGEPDAGVAAQLLERMLRWLRAGDERLQAAIRELLTVLRIESLVPLLETLRPATRRQLGQVARVVDLEAVPRLSNLLRHPVLARRLQAVEGVLALQAADELLGPLVRMVEKDFAEARAAALVALRESRSPHAVRLLQRLRLDPTLSDLPPSAATNESTPIVPPLPTADRRSTAATTNAASTTAESAVLPHPALACGCFWGWSLPIVHFNRDLQLGFLAMLLAIAIGAAWCLWQRHQRLRHSPEGLNYRLWQELCRAHRLSHRDRRALRLAAESIGLTQPAQLFVLPESLDQAIAANIDPRRQARLQSLRGRFFE